MAHLTKKFIIYSVIALVFTYLCAFSYGTTVPFSCRTMTINANVSTAISLNETAPFNVTPSDYEIYMGDTVTVVLQAQPGYYFTGFMIAARMDMENPVLGTWTSTSSSTSTIPCKNGTSNAIVQWGASQQTSITAYWASPTNNMPDIITIYVTVYENANNYWGPYPALSISVLNGDYTPGSYSQQNPNYPVYVPIYEAASSYQYESLSESNTAVTTFLSFVAYFLPAISALYLLE